MIAPDQDQRNPEEMNTFPALRRCTSHPPGMVREICSAVYAVACPRYAGCSCPLLLPSALFSRADKHCITHQHRSRNQAWV